jgi:hypothetical protein
MRLKRFHGKAQERRTRLETASRSSERRKALKGESHERWELKKSPEVLEGIIVERVAKPCGWCSQETG